MDYITAFSDGLQLLLNNGKSNFISPAIREATDRHCMIQIELALIILIKRFSLHPQQARTHTRRHTGIDHTNCAHHRLYLIYKNRHIYGNVQKAALVKTWLNVLNDPTKQCKNYIFGDNPAFDQNFFCASREQHTNRTICRNISSINMAL